MKISRSPRAQRILEFIVTHEPKTLYEIAAETKVPYNSLHLVIGNLVKKNLIELDLEKSRGRGRNATIYVPTFKGLLVFLSNYSLPQHPVGVRPRLPNEDQEGAIKRLEEKVKKQKGIYEREVGKLRLYLEKNGVLVRYPLFQHCRSLLLRPRLYELFIKISQAVLDSPFKMTRHEESLLAEKAELEKGLMRVEKLQRIGRFKLIVNGKEIPHDPTEFYRQQLGYVSLILNQVHVKEDEILRESFFVRFLWLFQSFQKLPNRELYDHTLKLLEKKRREFNSIKEQLEAGLALFGTS